MKVLQICFDCLPQSVGGTEVYVAGLARELMQMGHDVRIAITSSDLKQDYSHEGIPVDVLKLPRDIECPHDNLNTSKINPSRNIAIDYLRQIHSDIVHFHSLTLPPVLSLMEAANQLGIPSVCTYHTPTITCGRGDMLKWGKLPCDGSIDLYRCTSCVLHEKGVPKLVSSLMAKALRYSPERMAKWLPDWIPRKVRSTFNIPLHRAHQIRDWYRVVSAIDRWVAPSKWVKELLLKNGLPPQKVIISRQGLCYNPKPKKPATNSATTHRGWGFDFAICGKDEFSESNQSASARPEANKKLCLGYLGRIHAHKGLHLILQAMETLNGCQDISLKIAGPIGSVENRYRANFIKHTQNDSRISWIPRLAPSHIGPFLRNIDLLVVPSVWLETGPMTILEAWAEGIPVLGSTRGGIAEWINEYGGGWLFEPGSAEDLALNILHLKSNSRLLKSIKIPNPVRSIENVAGEMCDIYHRLASSPHPWTLANADPQRSHSTFLPP